MLTDKQWNYIKDIVPAPLAGGRPATISRRDLVSAMYYKVSEGIAWRQLPKQFPKWNTVFVYYNRWRKNGTWQKIMYTLYINSTVYPPT